MRYCIAAAGNRVGDVLCKSERQRGAVAMRFTPSVGDDMAAFACLGQTIFDAISVGARDDENIGFGGLGLAHSAGAEGQSEKKRKGGRPKSITTHSLLWISSIAGE
jgi:hypothetical protein